MSEDRTKLHRLFSTEKTKLDTTALSVSLRFSKEIPPGPLYYGDIDACVEVDEEDDADLFNSLNL